MLSLINRISVVLYIALIVYYLSMALLATLAIFKQSINRFIRKITKKTIKDSENFQNRNISFKKKFEHLIKSSLLVNDTLAILSIFFLFYVVSLLTIDIDSKIFIIPFIITILPYLWGFTRSTGVGVNAGTIGAFLGLLWFATHNSQLSWWDNNLFFFGLNLVANLSGWFGGFIGKGQIREAVAVGYFELEINDSNNLFSDTTTRVRKQIDDVFFDYALRHLKYSENISDYIVSHKYFNQKEFIAFPEKYKFNMQWRSGIRPQLEVIRWLFENTSSYHSTNEIIDNAFNVWRFCSTEVNITCLSEKESRNVIRLVTYSYLETPSIIWIDNDTYQLSLEISAKLYDCFNNDEECQWVIRNFDFFVLRKFSEKITLEQYSKNTFATIGPVEFLQDKEVENSLGKHGFILEDFFALTSFLESIRGRAVTLFAFLFSQIIIGILINWLTNLVPL